MAALATTLQILTESLKAFQQPAKARRWHSGYFTRDHAVEALKDCIAEREIVEADSPEIERIRGLWYITVRG